MSKIMIKAPEGKMHFNMEDSFDTFEIGELNEVQTVTGRKDKSGRPKKDYFMGVVGEISARIILAEEAVVVNQKLISENMVAAQKLAESSEETDKAKALRISLATLCADKALLLTENGFVAEAGEQCFWAGNPVGRSKEHGLIV